MSKVADVKISWKRSVSADVVKVQLFTTLDGNESVNEFPPEVESFVVSLSAQKSMQYRIVVTDSEGLTSATDVQTFTAGDLEAPQPVTELRAEIIGTHDEA